MIFSDEMKEANRRAVQNRHPQSRHPDRSRGRHHHPFRHPRSGDGVFSAFFHRREEKVLQEKVRIRMGRWLAVALEFELAADILQTAVAPTWDEIGKLGAIIVLRTTLNYFLQREIEKVEARDKREGA